MAAGDIFFAENSGTGHILNHTGQHKKTIELDTGITLYEFDYNDDKELMPITDRFGSKITIQRNENSIPTAIISPDGVTTYLTIFEEERERDRVPEHCQQKNISLF